MRAGNGERVSRALLCEQNRDGLKVPALEEAGLGQEVLQPRAKQVGDLEWSEPAAPPGGTSTLTCAALKIQQVHGQWGPEESVYFIAIRTAPGWVQRLNMHLAVLWAQAGAPSI